MKHRQHRLVRALAAVALITLYSFSLICPQTEAAETIRINGSGSVLDMVKPLAAAYRKAHPDVRIDIEKPLGSAGAIKALQAGALEIVASSRPLKPEEAAKGAIEHEYGKTPLLIVTERSVRKSNITTKELEGIYEGNVRTWPNGTPIRLILRPSSDADITVLSGLSPNMEHAISSARSHPGMTVAVTDPESNDLVARTTGAIGASGLSAVVVRKLPLNVLTLNGVSGTTKNLANGSYPLAKDNRFITTTSTTAAARKFLEFVYSSQGRSIAEKAGVLVSANSKTAR